MSYQYSNLDELKRKKELLKTEVRDMEDLLTFKNSKESLSAFTNGFTDPFLKEVTNIDGEKELKFDSAPIIRGIAGQLKSQISRNNMVQFVNSEPGSELVQNALKLGAVSFIANYAKNNMRQSSWKKKAIGLALIYVAPIVLKYVREKLENYQKNKTASSLEQLI